MKRQTKRHGKSVNTELSIFIIVMIINKRVYQEMIERIIFRNYFERKKRLRKIN
ncbi:hypothetical protein TPE_1018 [Treponema pedis str. T A4]|uniref:Uncharacterized protein n=1 Tax=Treponema pedis str. T A4 TaxID=1291379 RepID=S6A8B0_9SPIR|nr:hypothetical protein TPE_1018 [Treponema pedis str. T A4]